MAFSYTGGARSGGDSGTGSITHGLTINEGDLVVAYVNSNDVGAVSADAGGAVFNEALDETPSGQTARHALYWKIAGASEPSSYGFTFGDSAQYQILVKVFTSVTSAAIDATANAVVDASSSQNMVIEAIDSEVISDNALSIIFAGKDNRGAGGTWASADNSYTGVIGQTDDQDAVGAHRIYTTGETFSGSVTITDPGPSANDRTYSVHISFVERSRSAGIQILRRRRNETG